jgi:hypothetical protein
MSAATLRSFYEKPEVPASSGQDRARRQARMLTDVLRGVAAPASIVDVGSIQVSGASYHDVPRLLRPLDRAFCAWPAAASILLARACKR